MWVGEVETKYPGDIVQVEIGRAAKVIILCLKIGCVDESEKPRQEYVVLTKLQASKLAHLLLEGDSMRGEMYLPIWKITGTLYRMRQCPCCGEMRRTTTINISCNVPAADAMRAVEVIEQRILDAHENVIGDVIEEQSVKWVVGPMVSLAGVR